MGAAPRWCCFSVLLQPVPKVGAKTSCPRSPGSSGAAMPSWCPPKAGRGVAGDALSSASVSAAFCCSDLASTPKNGKKKKGPSQGVPPAPEDGLPDPEGNTQNLAGAQKAKKPQITGISAGAQPALAAAQLSSPPGKPPAVGSCRGQHPLCATQTELGPPHKCWGTPKPPRVFFLPALLQGKREAGLGRAVLTTEARAPFLWDRAPMCRGYKYQRAHGTSEADPL